MVLRGKKTVKSARKATAKAKTGKKRTGKTGKTGKTRKSGKSGKSRGRVARSRLHAAAPVYHSAGGGGGGSGGAATALTYIIPLHAGQGRADVPIAQPAGLEIPEEDPPIVIPGQNPIRNRPNIPIFEAMGHDGPSLNMGGAREQQLGMGRMRHPLIPSSTRPRMVNSEVQVERQFGAASAETHTETPAPPRRRRRLSESSVEPPLPGNRETAAELIRRFEADAARPAMSRQVETVIGNELPTNAAVSLERVSYTSHPWMANPFSGTGPMSTAPVPPMTPAVSTDADVSLPSTEPDEPVRPARVFGLTPVPSLPTRVEEPLIPLRNQTPPPERPRGTRIEDPEARRRRETQERHDAYAREMAARARSIPGNSAQRNRGITPPRERAANRARNRERLAEEPPDVHAIRARREASRALAPNHPARISESGQRRAAERELSERLRRHPEPRTTRTGQVYAAPRMELNNTRPAPPRTARDRHREAPGRSRPPLRRTPDQNPVFAFTENMVV